MSNLIPIIEDFSNKIFDIQQKLTDNEYKELIEELGKLYNNINLNNSLSQNNLTYNSTTGLALDGLNNHSIIPSSFYHACECDSNRYKCLRFSKLFNCKNRSPICHQIPFMEKTITFMDRNRILGGFAAPKYKMIINSPNTTVIKDNDIKLGDYLYRLFYNSNYTTEYDSYTKNAIYMCFMYFIIKNPNIILTQNAFCNNTLEEILTLDVLNKLIEYISNTNNINNLKFQLRDHIYDNIDLVLGDYRNQLLEIKSLKDLQPVQLNNIIYTDESLRINNHTMNTRRRCCQYKYTRNTTVCVNGRDLKYQQGDNCRIRCENTYIYCKVHNNAISE